jgi:glyoxylase-like metal-dependent hydrolase (beta-lactamase superfamily II)
MKIETVVVGVLETNCYLVHCEQTRECAVVDPGAEPFKIFQAIANLDLKPVVLINTHGHVDHVGANRDIIERFAVPLLLHEGDLPLLRNALQSEIAPFLGAKASPDPDDFLSEGQAVRFGRESLTVLNTPGHSPGSVSLKGRDILLSGDTLFFGGVGRTDLPGGSWRELEESVRNKIFILDDRTRVYPGHGPATSVEQEKNNNPYVR